jgi:large subunit ribosomal protein L4
MEATIYSVSGKSAGKVSLPENIFGVSWNADLVHQVVTSMATSARKPYAHTKTRGEVRGGGKKPWQQKGTGRARHGSTRSPIWVGGGVAHGPRNDKNFSRTISKKMKAKALYTVLSQKLRDGEILFVDSLGLSAPKTKDAMAALRTLSSIEGFEKLSTKKRNAALVALSGKSEAVEKSLRNVGSIEVAEARNLNPLMLLNKKFIIIENPEESLKKLPRADKAIAPKK